MILINVYLMKVNFSSLILRKQSGAHQNGWRFSGLQNNHPCLKICPSLVLLGRQERRPYPHWF